MSSEEVVQSLTNDRFLVAALRDPGHPQHAAALEYVRTRSLQIIRKHSSLWVKDSSLSDEDVCQNVVMSVIAGINRFRHQSAFLTWLTVIIKNESKQLGRKQVTKSRNVIKMPLDDYPDLVSHQESVENTAIHNTMIEHFEEVLSRQEDARLLTVFRMYYHHDATLEMIGAELNLGTSRIHALLKTVRTLLQLYLGSG